MSTIHLGMPRPSPPAASDAAGGEGNAFPAGHFVAGDLPSLAPIAVGDVLPGNALPLRCGVAVGRGQCIPGGPFRCGDLPSLTPLAVGNVLPGNALPLQCDVADGSEGNAFPVGHFVAGDLPSLAPIAVGNVLPGNALPLQCDAREWSGRLGFRDVGAIVYYLKAVPWLVPGFSVKTHARRLHALQRRLESGAALVFTARKYLIEARK